MKIIARTALLLVGTLLASPASPDTKLDAASQKAQEQLRKGHPEDAVKTLQKAVDNAPKDPAAHRALARIQARVGNLEEAHAAALKAAEVASPGVARAHALADLALLELRVAPSAKARLHADEAVREEANAISLAALARVQARQSDLAAIQTAERAVSADAASAAAQIALGWALVASRRHAEAEKAFRAAQHVDAESAEAATGLAVATAEQGNGKDALAAAQQAMKLDEKSGEALAAYALALRTQDPSDSKAEAIYQAVMGATAEPNNAWVKLTIARLYESRGQLDHAATAYREAATLDPSLIDARLAAIQMEYRNGEIDKALTAIRQLPPELARMPQVALLHGRLLLRKEKPAEAVKVLEQAAQAIPGSADVQAALGAACYSAGDVEKAAAAFKRASDLEPGNTAYALNYALFLGYAGKPAEAVTELKRITSKTDYKDPAGFINLGYMYRAMKSPKVTESVAAYQKALALDPKNGQAALGIALAYYGARQWVEAAAAFGRVAEIDKKLAGDAAKGTAWAYYFKRDMTQAKAWAEKAATAGVPDSKEIMQAITRYEEALKAGREAAEAKARKEERERESGASIGALADKMHEGNGAQQRQAAEQLCKKGAEAAPYLAHALFSAELGVRERIVACLRDMGCAAREALPVAQRIVDGGPPIPKIAPSRAEAERELIEGDVFRDVGQLAMKLKACR
jgi:superkiller protein 3